MSSPEEDFYLHLTSDADVTALVGTRVYPLRLPQAPTYPAITYNREDSDRVASLSGPSGLAKHKFVVDSWASTYAGVKALAKEVRKALGTFPKIIIGNDRDVYEPEPNVFRVMTTYTFWVSEDVS